ncbi:uncharacterized protein LOC142531158 isoform X1 [Primulina tabacum]|uniref:uncharacterized protein LOC142529856 isoform X1 n=1 Tax=Primulina tabacum TaxID=48773 RepID=UPI003F5A30B3
MDSKVIESVDSKAEFRKPLNDSAGRKYRRRSSLSGSSYSSDGSQRDRSSSPVPSKKDTAKVAEDKRKRDDGRGSDRDYGRSQSCRSSELYKHSDQKSSRSYHRHDEHHRRDKHVDDYDRGHSKSSYRSVRDLQDHHTLHSSRRERDHHGSRDYPNDVDIYSRKKSDGSGHRSRDDDSSDRAGSGRRHANSEDRNRYKDRDRQGDGRDYEVGKTDCRRSSGDHKSNHSFIYDEPKGQQNDSSSRRENSGHHWKEAAQRDVKGLDSETTSEEKRGHDHRDNFKEQCYGKLVEHTISDGTKAFSSNDQDSLTKKPKLFSHDVSVSGADGTSEQSYVTDSDIDAAKIAAMRAAELVNKNLVGTGCMSADQKKKLLWGSKKTTKIEESGHRWDTANFGDRERQEKFNKLMSLRLHWCLWPIVGRERRCDSGKPARQPQCGEAAGTTTAGIGEAIHCGAASEGWSYCWAWSLKAFFSYLSTCIKVFFLIVLYYVDEFFCKTNFYRMVIYWPVTTTN